MKALTLLVMALVACGGERKEEAKPALLRKQIPCAGPLEKSGAALKERTESCAEVEVTALEDGTYLTPGTTVEGAKSGAVGDVISDSRARGGKDYWQAEGVVRVRMLFGTFTNGEDIYMGLHETISYPNVTPTSGSQCSW